MKNQKGITLIALVITIIVLLILAGVSIAMLTGQNGILNRATDAQEASTKAEAEEALKLALAEILSNKLDPTYEGDEDVINNTTLTDLVARNNSNVSVTSATETPAQTTGTEPDITVTVPAYYTVVLKIGNESYTFYVETESGKMNESEPTA